MGSESSVREATRVYADAPAWHLAWTLDERLALRRGSAVIDRDRGERRLEMWKDEKLFSTAPELLTTRLKQLGMTEDDLVGVLGESAESLAARVGHSPEFARTLAEAWQVKPDDGDADSHDHAGFEVFALPLVRHGRRRIEAAVRELCANLPSGHVDADALVAALCMPPMAAISSVISRTMVLELNVLRIHEELRGDTPQERFADFLTRLRAPKYAGPLLAEYPVLARDLVRLVDNWVAARTEFAERLLRDLPDLVARFPDEAELGTVNRVDFDAGDSHRNGRSVAIVWFDNGVRVVYKPRPMRIDCHFQDMLRWLNDRGISLPLRTLWVLDRGDYGWSEFVEATGCETREEVARFYRRQGSYLALLHCLAAIDFHHENLIAVGEHPVLVDLEALFHPRSGGGRTPPHVPPHAMRVMSESVLSVGLLPIPILAFDDDSVSGVDLSGLGGPDGQLSPTPVPTFDDNGTDRMRLVRRRVAMTGGQNTPRLDGNGVTVLDFQEEIVAGFQETYRLLLAHRDELLSPDGPVETFSEDTVRVVLRSTRTYARILQEGTHPDLLRDAADRDRFYSVLWGGEHPPESQEAISAAEYAQIVVGDIPIFTACVASRDLVAGDGTVIPSVLETSGLQRARERISELSEEHLVQQTWFLQGSLTALVMGGTAEFGAGYRVPRAAGAAEPDAYLAAARRIGDRLLDLAVLEDDKVCWLGLTLVQEKVWQLGPATIDLYSGIAGIALFLGYLGEATGDVRYRRVADTAAQALVRQFERLAEMGVEDLRLLGMGACSELGGPLYALSHLGFLWRREDLLDAAELAVPHLRDLVEQDTALDVVSGSAGAVFALLALDAARGDRRHLDLCRALAAKLVSAGRRDDTGVSWVCSINPSAALTGFSHGASGIAVALSRVDRATGGREYADVVRAALAFERSTRDPHTGLWPDLRDIADAGAMSAWCHGAPGIGLARAELRDYLSDDDDAVRSDLRDAARLTLASGLGQVITGTGNHCLCHGDLGNVEALRTMGDALGDEAVSDAAERVAAGLLAHLEEAGPVCGVPLGVETPGLMAGLSGIGYGLLRFARPDEVPSVLLFEPPRR